MIKELIDQYEVNCDYDNVFWQSEMEPFKLNKDSIE